MATSVPETQAHEGSRLKSKALAGGMPGGPGRERERERETPPATRGIGSPMRERDERDRQPHASMRETPPTTRGIYASG